MGEALIEAMETATSPHNSEQPKHRAGADLAAERLAHEFNNLLTRVIGIAEQIQVETNLAAIHESAEFLIVIAEQAGTDVRRLISSGRFEPGHVRQADLAHLLKAWQLRQSTPGILIDVDALSVAVLVDPGLFGACLDELLTFARRSGASRMGLTAMLEADSPIVKLIFSVAASGMTPRGAQRPYGAEVGLAFVHQSLARFGGELRLEQAPCSDAVATLVLPAPPPRRP